MKKISLFLLLALVLSLFSGCSQNTTVTETVTFDDGSYMVVTINNTSTTYTTKEDLAAQLTPTSTTNECENPYYVYGMSHNDTQESYNIQPLAQYSNWGTNPSYGSYPKQSSTNQLIPQHYLDWIETEDGDKLPVWRDSKGNMLYKTKFATKYCSYYSADGTLLWTMSVTAMFKRNSVDQYCEVISGNITIWETDSWYVITENTSDEINSASYTVQFGRKNLGITIAEPNYTVTLSRDEKGNFK